MLPDHHSWRTQLQLGRGIEIESFSLGHRAHIDVHGGELRQKAQIGHRNGSEMEGEGVENLEIDEPREELVKSLQ
jgi:hypothetical protein